MEKRTSKKLWSVTCDLCKQRGPEDENAMRAIDLTKKADWRYISHGVRMRLACPSCQIIYLEDHLDALIVELPTDGFGGPKT